MERDPRPPRPTSAERSLTPGPKSHARKSNVGFAEMLDSFPGAWFFTRRDGTFAYVNLGACEALGYSRQQLLDATVFDIDPTMTRESWVEGWEGGGLRRSRTLRMRR